MRRLLRSPALRPLCGSSISQPVKHHRFVTTSALNVNAGEEWHGNMDWDWGNEPSASERKGGVSEKVGEVEGSIEITERAAKHISKLRTNQSKPSLALRVLVESGGCHGYQYKFSLLQSLSPPAFNPTTDLIFTSPGGEADVVTDRTSLKLLNGSKIDYATELIGSSFKVTENPNAQGAGCGCGVSWAPKLDK
ncbi:hypothetical protein BT69DRAFT_1281837 [Atractiella rhizophila]|nr:hypothetical protein BT69DRAFT_1281837 [Atractiella rhizophila]